MSEYEFTRDPSSRRDYPARPGWVIDGLVGVWDTRAHARKFRDASGSRDRKIIHLVEGT